MGPWKTNADFVTNLEIVNEIMMLVDVNPNPSLMYRSGGVFLYSLNLDSIT
jgi:hypothetical protein